MQDINLNYKEQIIQAQSAVPEIMEPLFWVLEDAIYDGKTDRAKAIYIQFLYIAKYRKGLVQNSLRPRYIERLQEIAYELYGTTSFKKREPIAMKFATSSKKLPFANEDALRDYLASHSDILSSALKQEIKMIDTEVEMDFDYRCDITIINDKYFFPIELKIGQANHQVVSQCNKYCFFFYRKLRYDRYRDIQGVVCASGFDSWAINELRREGIWIFDIELVSKKDIRLIRID